MAHFFIPTHTDTDKAYFHPAVRKDTVLDLSVKKLYAIKHVQRSTHRQANLRKTVLVYNVFKAAVSETHVPCVRETHDAGDAMDVDENRAAEQSWFDQCLDSMEEDAELLQLSDDDDDVVDDIVDDVEQSNPTVVTSDMTVFDAPPDAYELKRSPQTASVRALCSLGQDARMDCRISEDSNRWTKHDFGHGNYADLFAANSVSLGAPASCIY
ncbi:hypothetical protein GGH96_000433 [Coemansia sp. RSA 1972]|nr:hypothetical protein GGH96_000433 [Coemansia sp. RSA 1972]